MRGPFRKGVTLMGRGECWSLGVAGRPLASLDVCLGAFRDACARGWESPCWILLGVPFRDLEFNAGAHIPLRSKPCCASGKAGVSYGHTPDASWIAADRQSQFMFG